MILADKKLCCTALIAGHIMGILTGAAVVCITLCAAKKRRNTIADKAKQAFKTLEKTLSV